MFPTEFLTMMAQDCKVGERHDCQGAEVPRDDAVPLNPFF
jgi:hypothetical protein